MIVLVDNKAMKITHKGRSFLENEGGFVTRDRQNKKAKYAWVPKEIVKALISAGLGYLIAILTNK